MAQNDSKTTPATNSVKASQKAQPVVQASDYIAPAECPTEFDKYTRARHRLVVVWTWVGAILLAAVALYVSGVLAIPIGIIIWTAILVFILSGPVNFLEKHGVNRTTGAVLAYVLLIAVLAVLAFLMFSPTIGMADQFKSLAEDMPGYISGLSDWARDFYNEHSDIFQNETVKNWINGASDSFSKGLSDFASAGASGVVAFGTSIANVFVCIGFAFVAAFWMLIELPNLGKEAYRIIGAKYHEDAEMLHITVTRVMGGYLRTTIIQCAIIGVLCGIMFAILGVPSPAALGVITGLLNIIPIVGPWLGGGIAFIVSVLESPLVGIIALIGTIIIQQLIYTFISPKLMGDSVDIHPAATFVALMAGAGIGTAMGGLMGALIGTLLSIPVLAMAKSIFVYYFEKSTCRSIVSPDGVFLKGKSNVNSQGEVDPLADATGMSQTVDQPPSRLDQAFEEVVEKIEHHEHHDHQ